MDETGKFVFRSCFAFVGRLLAPPNFLLAKFDIASLGIFRKIQRKTRIIQISFTKIKNSKTSKNNSRTPTNVLGSSYTVQPAQILNLS